MTAVSAGPKAGSVGVDVIIACDLSVTVRNHHPRWIDAVPSLRYRPDIRWPPCPLPSPPLVPRPYADLASTSLTPPKTSHPRNSPETSTLSPPSTLPLFGLTQYCFGAVVLTLNAIGCGFGLWIFKLRLTVDVRGPDSQRSPITEYVFGHFERVGGDYMDSVGELRCGVGVAALTYAGSRELRRGLGRRTLLVGRRDKSKVG